MEDRNNSGIARRLAEEQDLAQAAQDWRNVVANRVDSYKTRRSRKRLAGEFSMKLDFNPHPQPRPEASSPASAEAVAGVQARPPASAEIELAQSPHVVESPAPAMEQPRVGFAPSAASSEPDYPIPQLEPPGGAAAMALRSFMAQAASVKALERAERAMSSAGPEPEPPPPSQPWYKPEGWTILAPPRVSEAAKVIEFPRAPVLFPVDELAEEVADRPRILDVPEMEPPAPPPLAELSSMAEEEVTPAPAPSFELPLRVASLPQRLLAALCDSLLVLASCVLFGAIVHRMCPLLPHSKQTLGALAVVPVILWTAYHYLFYVYVGLTPGMKLAGLRLNNFSGERPGWNDRRARALALVLSCASLGLGFAWALVDEDQLCWHDRITRTYLTQG